MQNNPAINEKKWSGLKITFLVIVGAILVSVLSIWLAKAYLFPKELRPTRLSAVEEKVLDSKIKALTAPQPHKSEGANNPRPDPKKSEMSDGNPTPEPYSEANAKREISLTERELNGLLARNTDLAKKLAIDLSDDLASAKFLIPLDPEFPFIGGKVLKVTAGLELRYTDQKPVVILRGISVWGVPIPNAWLGGIKNIDLVSEFGIQQGFWQSFSAGVDDIRIEEGQLSIKLKP